MVQLQLLKGPLFKANETVQQTVTNHNEPANFFPKLTNPIFFK